MADYTQNTKANLPHKSQTYSSPFDEHPIFGNIGGWVCDTTTMSLCLINLSQKVSLSL